MALEDKQLWLIVLTIVLGALALFAVGLRCISRLLIRAFGADDYLLLAAGVFFVPACVFAVLAGYSGIGRKDADLTLPDVNLVGTHRYLFLVDPFYLLSIACVKSSICTTLLRIVMRPAVRNYIFVVMALNILSTLIAFIALFCVCKPIAAALNPALPGAKCSSVGVVISLGYFVSATSLTTDFSCAILPIFILWKVQMSKRAKVTVATILGVGLVASMATIVRIPWFGYYKSTVNHYYNLADIIGWTMLENGLGIIAASAAALKPLVRKIVALLGTSSAISSESDPPVQLPPHPIKSAAVRMSSCWDAYSESTAESLHLGSGSDMRSATNDEESQREALGTMTTASPGNG